MTQLIIILFNDSLTISFIYSMLKYNYINYSKNIF